MMAKFSEYIKEEEETWEEQYLKYNNNEYNTSISSVDDYGPDSNNINLISEAGLSRLIKCIEKSDSFAILTTYRDDYDKNQNIKRNRNMRVEFNKRKMGPYQLVGHWNETQDDGTIIDGIERSYLVIKPESMDYIKFERLIVSLVKKFNQDAALINDSGMYFVIDGLGTKTKIGTKLTINKIGQAYSQYVKKMNVPFIFEGIEVPSSIGGIKVFVMDGLSYILLDNKEYRNEAKNWKDIVKNG